MTLPHTIQYTVCVHTEHALCWLVHPTATQGSTEEARNRRFVVYGVSGEKKVVCYRVGPKVITLLKVSSTLVGKIHDDCLKNRPHIFNYCQRLLYVVRVST